MTENVDSLHIRPLLPEDWEVYKFIRLKALQTDRAMLTSTYELEATYPDARWQASVAADDNRQIFGVFHHGTIIGMTAVRIEPDKPDTAWFWGSWLDKDWRGMGLTKKLFATRFEWLAGRHAIKRVVMAHRLSNLSSKHAIVGHGFHFTHSIDHTWPDGETEPNCFYELKLDTSA